jgi:hypothetical protein
MFSNAFSYGKIELLTLRKSKSNCIKFTIDNVYHIIYNKATNININIRKMKISNNTELYSPL